MLKTLKFDPRKLMQKAIAVMRESVAEYREDDSPSPMVGAVLWQPDSPTVTAARGELRDGDHAEFTLLERKCVSDRLDDSILFTTLEPCLERNDPKRGCAKHIVGARIREVYVGIEDDNPMIAGKGIEHLRRCGVKVHMFDRDLQEIILEENEGFFKWARRQPEKREPEPIKLSDYEDPLEATLFDDLSTEALERYRTKAGIGSAVHSSEFSRLLQRQGLLVKEADGAVVPTGFGYLLFGKEPRSAMPQSGLLARAELADGKSSRKEFGKALVLIPSELELWLRKILPSTVDLGQMERREQVDLPFAMIREAVVNALVHRDYEIKGQKCQLVVTGSTVTVSSPGGLTSPITMEQMQSFSAPMKSRNPVLHYVFARMGFAEEQGFGLTRLKKLAVENELPLPRYSLEDDSLVLTIYRNKAAAIAAIAPNVLDQLSVAERRGWEWLATKDVITSQEYSDLMGIPNRTALNHLKRFTQFDLLEKVGTGKATKYTVRH